MKENSKVFITLGGKVGINVTKKTQRGIVARRTLEKMEAMELKEFGDSFGKFELKEPRSIKVNYQGRQIDQIFI